MTAFSNGFEHECWSANWCYKCTKDEIGLAPKGIYCAILTDVMADNTVPPQWTPGTDDLRDRYHCSEFRGKSSPAGGGRQGGLDGCNL